MRYALSLTWNVNFSDEKKVCPETKHYIIYRQNVCPFMILCGV